MKPFALALVLCVLVGCTSMDSVPHPTRAATGHPAPEGPRTQETAVDIVTAVVAKREHWPHKETRTGVLQEIMCALLPTPDGGWTGHARKIYAEKMTYNTGFADGTVIDITLDREGRVVRYVRRPASLNGTNFY